MKSIIQLHVALALAFVLFAQNSAEAQNRVRLEVQLTPTNAARNLEPFASAKAKYEERNGRRKFSCEAEDLFFSVDEIAVFRGNKFLGTAMVNIFGTADLNLDTLLGDSVPRMRTRQTIRVFDVDTGVLLFRGRLAPR